MDFATDYKDFFTFIYYVLSLLLQLIVFVWVYIYLKSGERKQHEKDQAEKQLQRDKEQRKQELREWRQFSEIINMEYIRLKSNGVLQRVQKVLDSLKQIRIFRNFGGLDVLRYMMIDEHVEHFDSPELRKLRLDLDSIFIRLNHCWSLCSLGEVPSQFVNGQLGRVVSELGQLTLPFFQGNRNKTVTECLRKFRSNRPTIQDNSRGLEQEVPYVKYFRFEEKNQSYYAAKTPLTLNVDDFTIFDMTDETNNKKKTLKFLRKLNNDLDDIPYAKSFVTKLRPKIGESSFRWIKANVNDEEIIVNLLHEVRYYIWKGIEEDYDSDELKHNIEQLKEVSKLTQEGSQLTPKAVICWSQQRLLQLERYLKRERVISDPELVSRLLIELIEREYQEMQEWKENASR